MKHQVIASALAFVLLLTSSALAQSSDVMLDQRGQMFRPADLTLVQQAAMAPSAGQTGGDDLILLDEVPLLVFRAGASAGYTTNAFLSGMEEKHDYFTSLQVQTGLETTIAESFELRLLGNVGSVRYQRFEELNFDQLGGLLEISRQFQPARFGLRYNPSSFHDNTFNEQQLMLHPLTLFAQKDLLLPHGWFAAVETGMTRSWGQPSDYDSTSVYIESSFIRQLAPGWFISGTIELRYTSYDDFFESTTNTDRQDYLIRPAIQLSYQPRPWLLVTAQLSGARNFSELDEVDYAVATLTPSVQVQWRF